MSATIIPLNTGRRSISPVIGRITTAMEQLPLSDQQTIVDMAEGLDPTPRTREQRHMRWLRAEAVYNFYDRLRDMALAANRAYEQFGLQDAKAYAPLGDMGPQWKALGEKLTAAGTALVLTPAPTASALNRKKGMRRRGWQVSKSAVEASIAADEVWLAANRRNKKIRSV